MILVGISSYNLGGDFLFSIRKFFPAKKLRWEMRSQLLLYYSFRVNVRLKVDKGKWPAWRIPSLSVFD